MSTKCYSTSSHSLKAMLVASIANYLPKFSLIKVMSTASAIATPRAEIAFAIFDTTIAISDFQ